MSYKDVCNGHTVLKKVSKVINSYDNFLVPHYNFHPSC